MAMPLPIQNEIKLMKRKKNHQVIFAEMMQVLEKRFGEGRSIGKRQKWKEISLNNNGKIQMAQFKDFETRLRLGELEVKDSTPQESYRMLMDKLPSFMVTWVIEAEEKLAQSRPTVSFVGFAGMGLSDATRNIENLIGISPKEVSHMANGGFLVRFDDVSHAAKLLKLHGRSIAGTHEKIQVRETDLHLPTEGIFRLIESKLLLREKSEAFHNSKDMGNAFPSRQTRQETKRKKGGDGHASPTPVLAVGAQG